MFTRLTLGDIERTRLVLRGGTVIDWRRLNVSSVDECDAILRSNEIDPEDPGDAARLINLHRRAIDYLERNFELICAKEVVNAPRTSDLMLLAAGRDPVLRPQACMMLKLMHVVHHIDSRELRLQLAVSDKELFHLVEEKAMRVAQEMRQHGFPIVEFVISRKSHDSLITKHLRKRQTFRARVFDRVRFRIVTETADDIIPVVAYLNQHLFPFNYVVPGESRNSIFAFPDIIRRHPRAKAMIPRLQVDLEFEDEMRPPPNTFTSDIFRTIKFVADIPIRVDEHKLLAWAPGKALSPGVVYVLTEFQIVDQASHIANERGEASHEKYEARRMAKVRKRLLNGKLIWRGMDSI
jgi:uncharacterized protein (TIGR04552 family)